MVGEQGVCVKCNWQLLELLLLGFQLGEIIFDVLCCNLIFFVVVLFKKIMLLLFNSYEGGEYYGLYVDGLVCMLFNVVGSICIDVLIMVFLFDLDEYDGGELVVVDIYGIYEVKLLVGDMIVYFFISLYWVELVMCGVCVCFFFWIQSMICDDWKCSMFFELDCNIFGLWQKLGDIEEVLGLMGYYYNLL